MKIVHKSTKTIMDFYIASKRASGPQRKSAKMEQIFFAKIDQTIMNFYIAKGGPRRSVLGGREIAERGRGEVHPFRFLFVFVFSEFLKQSRMRC